MRFESIKRDCTSRMGKLEIKGKEILTPSILWYSSERIKPPLFSSFLLSLEESDAISHSGSFFYPMPEKKGVSIPPSFVHPYAFPPELHKEEESWNREHAGEIQIISPKAVDEIHEDTTIYVLSNARELFSNPRNFIRAVVDVRNRIGYQKALYAPGLGEPSHIAILSYFTIDIFDSIPLIEKARRGVYLFPEGGYSGEGLEEMPCSCPACREEERSFSSILEHNYYAAFSELKRVRNAIRNNELRNLVESRAASQPEIASMLRIMDGEYYRFQEERCPVSGGRVICSPLSLKRSDIERFRRRVINRYVKPISAKILLLLPCSAKKPYSYSKSHSAFRRAINSCKNPEVVHEVIVTSPLGIVPMELEMIYPAAHYDISVTGEWSLDEREMVKKQLDLYVRKNEYDAVINHLPEEMAEFIDIGEKTCRGHPVSADSIENLSKALDEKVMGYEKITKNARRIENVKSIISYQFGGNILPEGCRVKGKYPNYKIFYRGKQLGMMVGSRGMVSLTIEGGEMLAEKGLYCVEIEDFVPHGSIFAIGVKDADREIRCGDEVVATHDGEVRAVGVAEMSGEEMVESSRGIAVKVRHHKK